MEKKKGYCEVVPSHTASFWKKFTPLLHHLDIELTERCNNNCIHCYINLPANDSAAEARELSTKEIQLILTEAASLGCLSVLFSGGEPLLRDDFEEIYLSARRLGMKVRLFTNATLITPRLADLLSTIPPLESIEISVYGMKRESYEAVTRSHGSFDAAWRGINLLLAKGVPFAVKSVWLPPNKGELQEFEQWAASIPWMEKEPSVSTFLDLRGRRDSEWKNSEIESLRPSPQEGLGIISRRPEQYRRKMQSFCSRFMGATGSKLFSCGAGQGTACVDAYGMLQMCMMLRDPDRAYRLKSGTLKDALLRFFPQMRQLEAGNPDYLSRCARCSLKGLCDQCPAKSYMAHGTLDTPVAYYCELAHAQAEQLGLLRKGERGWEMQDKREVLP